MAIQLRSPGITNFKAGTLESTKGITNDYRVQVGDIAVTTAALDAIGSVIVYAQVTHKSIIDSILISNTDMDTHSTPTLAFNLGLYTYDFTTDTFTLASTVAAASLVACFASASTQFQAAAALTELSSSASNVRVVAKMATRVSDLLGDANINADRAYFIAATLTAAAATSAAGTTSFRIATIG